jgi:hypothetical protein
MEQKRKYERFDPAIQIDGYFELSKQITGEFRNREEFLIKNISLGGINLISNYAPAIGNPYQVFINYSRQKHEFMVNIIHSRILRFQDQADGIFKPGVVYSTGCEIVFENESQKNLIQEIIKNECVPQTPETPVT